MARRRRQSSTRRSDETFDFSSDPPLLRQLSKPTIRLSPVVETIVRHTAPTALRDIEDRRTYHPQGKQRPARSIDKPTHRLVMPVHPKAPAQNKRTQAPRMPHTVQFAAPKKVLVCIRRKTRKEVLHALNKTGKGARARHRRQSEYTTIRC